MEKSKFNIGDCTATLHLETGEFKKELNRIEQQLNRIIKKTKTVNESEIGIGNSVNEMFHGLEFYNRMAINQREFDEEKVNRED